ncbi:ribokinase [Deinococcus metalli]|uniref:Ribokinase n=1 Tax=Deinococcus metalli TaxID=1141878 RepID=A0A7W8KCQ7_9DEIO|nr:PfkB family carbohydrate kinase [Deinococcus metalli]MBB5375790.1 ribokinase [Deinococcus metalli]GHF37027.1 ribokinase [Deinococcus metalli]
MSEAAVLVAGSLHVDRMVQVEQLPVPGETVIATGHWSQLGGKAANQAVAAAQLVRTTLAACVGNDADGQQAREALIRLGVHTALQISGSLATGSSVALLDHGGENVGVVVPGANADLKAEDVAPALRADPPRLLVCQWETAAPTLHRLLEDARAAGIPVLLNAAPWRADPAYHATLALADHVVVNAVEARAWTGSDPSARAAHLPLDHPSVVVTLGAGGVLHYRDGVLTTDLPAPAVQARSTHGAGDHFVGVLAGQIARGTTVPDALGHAVTSAADFVQLLHKHDSVS